MRRRVPFISVGLCGKPMFTSVKHRLSLRAAVGLCAAMVVGCAGLPRIDPSGERIFLWPNRQSTAVAPVTNNAQAPPVFTAPVYPPATTGNTAAGQTNAGVLPPVPQDILTITPNRVLAPVGSEVILKAGLCTREGFLLTDSKVDWLVARDEVGELVSLGGRGYCRNPLLPWNKPKKIDNNFGTGYTAKVPLQISRGTADTTDDVQIEPGEAWASITSPVEGTSRITAVAPEIETWSTRRATATIYWVDVQWTFPPATVTAGGSQVLTTTVRRQTDGTPIEGWLVRYEVADGGGQLRGSESGQVVEVPTDAQGRASIDVTPTGSAGSFTRINSQVVRPERYAESNAPRLVIANGTSTVNWTDGGSDYLPPPDNFDNPLPTYPVPEDTVPRDVLPSVEPTPAPPVSRRGPELELVVNTSDTQVQVGQSARFEVIVKNLGGTTATGIVLEDSYDEGLTHPSDPQRFLKIKTTLDDIPPGGEATKYLTFETIRPGTLCQYLTVTYDGGGSTQKQACIEAIQPREQPQGRLQVTKESPRQRNVGEMAMFSLRVRNTGEAPLTNIEIIDEYDRAFLPQPPPAIGAQLRDGRVVWAISQLDPGEMKQFDVSCQCVAPKLEACSVVNVSAETGTSAGVVSTTERTCMEIRQAEVDVMPPVRPAPDGNVLPGVNPPPAGAVNPNTSPLQMEITPLFTNPARAGTRATYQIVIRNAAAAADQQVELRVLFPQELTPDEAAIRNDARVASTLNVANGELLFAPIQEIRPDERLEFIIPCNVNQQGARTVRAVLSSRNMPQALSQTHNIEIQAR